MGNTSNTLKIQTASIRESKGSGLERKSKKTYEDHGSDTMKQRGHERLKTMPQPGLNISNLESKNEHKDHGSVTMKKRGHERLKEMSEPDVAGSATGDDIGASLNELISHLQISMQRKLNEKRKECILTWTERVYPDIIIKAVKEIDNANNDRRWKESLQKAKTTVEMIEGFADDIFDKQELLAYIYSYFGPTYIEIGDFNKAMGFHEEDWRIAVERLLKTLPEDKYLNEVALLNFEIAMYNLHEKALLESCKRRSLYAAKQAKVPELQLYGTVLFTLIEWKASHNDSATVDEIDYFEAADSMERSLELAKQWHDNVATRIIQSILQAVNKIRREYRVPFEAIRCRDVIYMGISRGSTYSALPFTPDSESLEETENSDHDETTRKSDTRHPVPETEPDEETDPKVFVIGYRIPDEEETSAKVFDGDTTHPDDDGTHPKMVYTAEMLMHERLGPEGASETSSFQPAESSSNEESLSAYSDEETYITKL